MILEKEKKALKGVLRKMYLMADHAFVGLYFVLSAWEKHGFCLVIY